MVERTHRVARLAASLLVVFVTSCGEPNEPFAGVELRTQVVPATAWTGDTVVLRAILTNRSTRQAYTSAGCGPPVRIEIRAGSGSAIYPIPIDATFTCQLTDISILEPGETDTLVVPWRVAATVGEYGVRSGFLGSNGLLRLTAPVALSIR
jgi:hypothetical protein